MCWLKLLAFADGQRVVPFPPETKITCSLPDAILHADHLQMAAVLGLTRSSIGANVKSELPEPVDPLYVSFSPAANPMTAPELASRDSKPTNMAESPLKVPQLPLNAEIVVTKMFSTQNALQGTPSNKRALQRRPLSSRSKRFPRWMNDFWAWPLSLNMDCYFGNMNHLGGVAIGKV